MDKLNFITKATNAILPANHQNLPIMRKNYYYLALTLIAGMFSLASFAQSLTINGTVSNGTSTEMVSAVTVLIKGSTAGTYTDEKGAFKISTSQKLPITLVFSSIGFATKEVVVSNASQNIIVALDPSVSLAEGVVVSASRTPERILDAPVTVERISTAAIRNAAAPSYYDVIGNLKGVDMTTSSINFKTISTRGFNGSGNLRFNQLVDGMDNQAPGLNFSVGSVIGLTELDVESMELLPGASSALYGSGGMNGTLLINSKNPFKYQGLSYQVRQGINHVDGAQREPAPFFDWSVRYAKKISEKFAFKFGGQFIQSQDWQARDTRNLNRNNVLSSLKDGDRGSDPNYDGVNVFGDEASASMQAFAQAVRFQVGQTPQGQGALAGLDGAILAGATPQMIYNMFPAQLQPLLPFLIPTSTVANNPFRGTFGGQNVSRTGYAERDLVDYNAYNVRLNGGLYYKITPSIEASLTANFGMGTTVYTGADRYSLRNLKMGQYKVEFKGANWFLRGYTTQENSGDSYTATTAAVAINNEFKSNANWFQQYTAVYGSARLGIIPVGGGNFAPVQPNANAHNTARGIAEAGRFLPGSAQYQTAFEKAKNISVGNGGAKFADRSNLYHVEGQLNLTQYIKVVDVLVGANFRNYSLNSQGTIFADTAGKISINEYGGYLQLQKSLFNDVLKLTASGRFDKNQNFEGRFTPRVSALIRVAKDNNIRLSYQTAYRFPSTQDQYINLATPGARLIGGLPEFNTFFNFNNAPAKTAESIVAFRNSLAAGAPNPALLQNAVFTTVKPETVQSYEVGYKALIAKKLFIDVYGYYSQYKDFIARVAVGRGQSASTNPAVEIPQLASPFTTTNYSFVTNSPSPVKSIGYGIGLEYNLVKNYIVSGNFYTDELRDVPSGLVTFFNTPKYRTNIGFSNTDVYKGFGFNVIYRWQDKIYWEGTFGSGEVPDYETVDAMISYKFSKIKSLGKIGATNILNKYYRSAFGNPDIGGLYYISFAFNVF